MIPEPYAWHAEPRRIALAAIDRGAHALLVAGPRGIGKRDFALRLAAGRLCESPGEGASPCGRCESCRWFVAGTHPDFALVEPLIDDDEAEGAGKQPAGARERPINIDQIRRLGELLALTSHRQAGKVVMIHPAESMNLSAANALLKNLEEPPSPTLFLLIAHRPALLPPTVRSRCQHVQIRVVDWAATEHWLGAQGIDEADLQLALSGGAPLEALAAATNALSARRAEFLSSVASETDGVTLAERFRDLPPAVTLGWLQKWTFDLLCMRFTGRTRYHLDLEETTRSLSTRIDARAVGRLHRRLIGHQRHIHHPLNPRLLTEQILIDCRQVLASTEAA